MSSVPSTWFDSFDCTQDRFAHHRSLRACPELVEGAGFCFEIGFVWVCFAKVAGVVHFHNPFANSSLQTFGFFEIGFVLHKILSRRVEIHPMR